MRPLEEPEGAQAEDDREGGKKGDRPVDSYACRADLASARSPGVALVRREIIIKRYYVEPQSDSRREYRALGESRLEHEEFGEKAREGRKTRQGQEPHQHEQAREGRFAHHAAHLVQIDRAGEFLVQACAEQQRAFEIGVADDVKDRRREGPGLWGCESRAIPKAM